MASKRKKNLNLWIRVYLTGFCISLVIPMTLVGYGILNDNWDWLKDLAIPSGILSFTLLQLLHVSMAQRFEEEKHDESKRADFVRKVTMILCDHHDLEHKVEKYNTLMRSTGILEREARVTFPNRPIIASEIKELNKIYTNTYKSMLKSQNTSFYEDIEDISDAVTNKAILIYHGILEELYTREKF